jgi:hypothetical protein
MLADVGIGTGVRINCISPGQIDVGVDLHNVWKGVPVEFVEMLTMNSSICGE